MPVSTTFFNKEIYSMHCTPKKLTSKIISYALAVGMILSSPGVVHAYDCPHEHKTEHFAVAATCTEDGNGHYFTCDDCNMVFAGDGVTEVTLVEVTISAPGHHFGDWTSDGDGTHTRTCISNGCSETETLPHDFVLSADTNVCVCGATRSSSFSGESSEPTAAELEEAAKQVEVETIARIESAQPGDTVVVQSETLSENTMDALIANPEVTAQIGFEYGGEQVTISFQNPIITERVPFYGPENLIGIYNRDQMLRIYTSLGFDPDMIRTLLAEDARNAAKGEAPVLNAPAGGFYIYMERGTLMIRK